RITMANGSMLGGHVHVESFASISGGVAVHHYVTIGGYSFVGGQSRIYHDVPRFMLVDGNPSKVRCINIVGLKRNGIGEAGTAAFDDHRELLGRVDAVSVAVPTRLHREVAGAFLERGIPAMVEKPLASSVAEAEELVALARDRATLLQVGHIERFNPALSAL